MAKKKKSKRSYGRGSLFERNGTWYYAFMATVDGTRKRVERSTGTNDREEAQRLMMRDMIDRQSNGVSPLTTRLRDLHYLVEQDYADQGRNPSSLYRHKAIESTGFFDSLVSEITPTWFDRYIKARRVQRTRKGTPPSNATINRELALIHRILQLAYDKDLIKAVPRVKKLGEDNVRKGFFENSELEAVLEHLNPDLRPVFKVAAITGWRMRELLSRRWQHVSLQEHGWIRLDPGETKNKDGRIYPLIKPLREILQKQWETKERLEKELGHPVHYVFMWTTGAKAGMPIRVYNEAWREAAKAAGVDRIPHDLRRTAVRNSIRAGLSTSAAMLLSGHETVSVFDRYAIKDDKMMRESGKLVEQFLEGGA